MIAWPTKALSEICRPRQWPTLSKADMLPAGLPVYGANGVIGYTDRPTHRDQTILIGCRGSCGTVHRLQPPAYANGNAMALDELRSDIVDLNFLEHFLRHRGFEDVTTGASQPQIVQRNLNLIRIPVPPLGEQQRIAAILDQADELRRKRQRAIDRLNQLGQAIFHEMFGDIGSLPRTHTFEDVATIQQSLVDPKRAEHRSKLHVGPEHIASGAGIVAWENVRTAEEDNIISGKNWFKSGDIIYSKIRPYLNKVAIADRDGLCSADMYVIQPINGKSNAAFLRMLLMGRDYLAYAETCSNRANIPKVNRKQVENYRFHCPSLQAQKEFAERMAEIEKIATPFAAAAKSASDLFGSLQQRAFRGEL